MASFFNSLRIRLPPSPMYNILPLGPDDDVAATKSESKVEEPERPRGLFQYGALRRMLPYLMLANLLFMIYVLFQLSSSTPANDISLPSTQMHDVNATTHTFNTYIGDVETFLHDHPNSVAEESSFSRMGLFTRLYARLLQDKTASPDLLNSFESALWYFAPGIKQVREKQNFITNVNKKSKLQPHSRGIVIPVGKENFIFANHFISSIREVHKSNMPIEIVYRDEADLPLHQRNFLTSTFTNLITTGIKTMGVFNQTIAGMEGWATKPFALVASNFSEVMLADADAVLLAPPETFFDNEDYQKTGTLFFSDRNVPMIMDNIHNWLLKQFGKNGPGPTDSLGQSYFWKEKGPFRQESGILVLDKRRAPVFAALLFAAWQNVKEIRDKVTYTMFHGDKETFWLAFEIARLPYYMNNHGAGGLGAKHHIKSQEFCGEHPLHFFEAPNGSTTIVSMEENPPLPVGQRPLLSPAWMNGSLRDNKNNHDSSILLDPGKTIWSMDGEWYWGGTEGAYCLKKGFTAHTMGEFNLGPLIDQLVKEAAKAEKRAKEYLESV